METIVKTISGGESDVTPLCTTAPLRTIMLIVCKIRTKRSRGEECRLLYQYGEEIDNDCDSKFRLIKGNQTIFLHLTGLTSLDSGNHSCECSHAGGTGTLHLNITVEGDEEEEASTFFNSLMVVGGVAAFVIVSGVFLGLILRKNHCRQHTRSEQHEFPECEIPCPLEDDDLYDPYENLQLPTNDVYEAISS
ncbi:uncharacterized protein LOC122872375 isoform X2 [Scomber scombrus]|uniref:Uncharacterized protein LOC122872375 isoform X2 n=1 Tax=Scomber scombrus TaxID=13677 RepID=A0AAV1Q232_SCOSC